MEGRMRKFKVTIEAEIEEFNYDEDESLIPEIAEYLQLPDQNNDLPFEYDPEDFARHFVINSIVTELSPTPEE